MFYDPHIQAKNEIHEIKAKFIHKIITFSMSKDLANM